MRRCNRNRRCIGRPLIYRFADSRWGRLMFLSGKKLEYAENLFRKRGNISTFIGRLLPAGRQFISIPAGLARMNFGAFVFYTAAGLAIWNSLLVGAGYYLSYLLPEDEIVPALEKYGMQANVVFFRLAFCFACRLCGEALCAQTAGKGIKRRLYG